MICSKVLARFADHRCLLSLLDELSMEKRDSNGFFSRRLACRTSDGTYNSTDSSLVTVDYQQNFLALCLAKVLIRHMQGHAAYYVHMHILVITRCLV